MPCSYFRKYSMAIPNKSIEYEELNEAIDRLEYALEKNENIPGEIDSMSRLFAQMYILQSLLYNSNIDSELFDEIYYPADRVRYDGLAGIYAIQYLLKKLNGELDNSLLKKVDYALNRSETSRFVYSPQRIQKFVEYLKNTDLSKAKQRPPSTSPMAVYLLSRCHV